jgi:hypothetical protein
MSSNLGSINTNFTAPNLPDNPTTQQTLEFSKQMMVFATAVSAAETAINTEGNVEKRAASDRPQ